MNVNIVSTVENKLLGRKEVTAEISFDGTTPKRAELKSGVCTKVAGNPDNSALRRVSSKFGKKLVSVLLHVYPTKESMMATEPVYVKVREGFMAKPEKKKKKAATAAKKK
ncbi:hypothetical protein HY990_04080 [Candidatus Micrarchaeota archaeon]|nr:hypothetical protein [Candidatus Micrarchaeota archaeon]